MSADHDVVANINSINELESIINAGPDVITNQNNETEFDNNDAFSENEISNQLPKPFNKFLDINGRGAPTNTPNDKTLSSPGSTSSPLNNGLFQSPNTFIESIPESKLLEGCVCFADVWSKDGNDNRSHLFGKIVRRMGATVVRSFTKRDAITHLIFKDGHKLYLKKAKKRNILIVTCSWVEKCRVTQVKADVNDYLFDDTNYKPPKKFKEMQPIDEEEQLLRSADKERKLKNKKPPRKKNFKFFSPLASGSSTVQNGSTTRTLALETPYHDPSPYRHIYPRYVPETPDENITKKIERMKAGKPIFTPPSSPCSSSDEDVTNIKENLHVGNHVPVYNRLCTRLNFLEEESQENKKQDHPSPKNGILLSQKSLASDMELTCINVKEINLNHHKSPDISSLSDNNQSMDITDIQDNKNPSPTNTTHSNSTTPSLNLHLSSDQSSLNFNSSSTKSNLAECQTKSSTTLLDKESSFQLKLEGSLDSTMSQTKELSLDLVDKEVNDIIPNIRQPKKKRTRRKLCEEETLKPASILYTPNIESQPLTPRRSSRRSSIIATVAITSSYFQNTRTPRKSLNFHNSLPPALDTTNSSSKSTLLPPVGESTVKLMATRSRFFSTPTVSPGDAESSSNEIPRSREQSLSTSYEDMEILNPESTPNKKTDFVADFIAAGLSGKRKNTRGSTLLKRNRPSSSSSSSSGENINIRKSCRKPSKKSQCLNYNTTDKNTNQLLIQEPVRPRRSTDEFVMTKLKNNNGQLLTKKRTKKQPVIVLTSFHTEERSQFEKMVLKLGRFRVHSRVKDERTSHVICGEKRRTINVLLGITRGLWLLSKEWVIQSHEAGEWLPEEKFEVFENFPAARYNRLQRHCRLNSATAWKSNLFSSVEGHVYIAPDTTPSTVELKELVTSNGGRVINSPGRAAIRVGHMTRSRGLEFVQETWVLDSISENELKPIDNYLIL